MATLLIRQITLGGELPFSTQHLHRLTNTASGYKVKVLIKQGNNTYNGKSLLGLLAMARAGEREITLMLDGEEEQQAAEALCALLSGEGSGIQS